MLEIVEAITSSDAERRELKLDKDQFTIYWTLKENKFSNDIVSLSKKLLDLLNASKNWPFNKKAEREIRRSLYKLLIGHVPREGLSDSVKRILEMHKRMLER